MSHHKPNPNKSVSLTINGLAVTVPEGTRILDAARKAGVHIPTLCDHPDLCKSPSATRAVCRICVVECDGRGKLLAACANDVWEGVNVVTHNARIISIRKMIVELLLATHPRECLSCIRSKDCELQSLAAQFGVRESVFYHETADRRPPVTEGGTLERDMAKCVKCGRCVEACQEVQTIRAINSSHRSIHYEINTPYGQALGDGPCIFCGYCASVCPVGAIYGHDQSAEVWAALNNGKNHVVVQAAPAIGAALGEALNLPEGSLTAGKMVTALKRLGFKKVFNTDYFADAAKTEKSRELSDRMMKNGKSPGSLPMITGCSPGLGKFIENCYPDLAAHLSTHKSPRQLFKEYIRTQYLRESGADPSSVITVSIEPCLANKFKAGQPETDSPGTDLVLTVGEFARLIRMAGIDFTTLPETAFGLDKSPGTETGRQGIDVKVLTVNGIGNARAVFDSIRKGECNAVLVEVMLCPR